MDFEEIVQKRQSCRRFDKNKPVDPETLRRILNVARLAPSACNAQPYVIYAAVGRSAQSISKARRLSMNRFIEDCPAFFVIAEDSSNIMSVVGSKVSDTDYRSVDIGIVCAYITSAATELGLDTCILGIFDGPAIQEILKTKKRIRLVIAVGYAAENDALRPKKRKDENDFIFYVS